MLVDFIPTLAQGSIENVCRKCGAIYQIGVCSYFLQVVVDGNSHLLLSDFDHVCSHCGAENVPILIFRSISQVIAHAECIIYRHERGEFVDLRTLSLENHEPILLTLRKEQVFPI